MPLPLVYHPAYSFPFPERHRFPMAKFGLLADYLRDRGILTPGTLFRPGRCRDAWLEQAHCPDYVARFRANTQSSLERRQMNLPWSEGLCRRTLLAPSGTVLAAQLALHYGMASHLAGGTHHAHYDHASGFCILNDLAIAARVLLNQGGVGRVLIFDCDVHQGDGTAAILADEPRAFTCSIHCEKNFPFIKQTSDRDIELAPGLRDGPYVAQVMDTLIEVLDQFRPDIVLYDAGVDVFADDPLGLLQVSEAGIDERDRQVLIEILGRGIPVATVIGGGYDDDRKRLARRHAIVTEVASELYPRFCG